MNNKNPNIVCLSAELDHTAFKQAGEKGDLILDGWFITENIIPSEHTWRQYDLQIPASAFEWDGAFEKFNGRIMPHHNLHNADPIGKELAEYRRIEHGKGFGGRVKIFSDAPPLTLRAIREGVLNSFSVGINILETQIDKKKGLEKATKAQLLEISTVNLPADSKALFEVAEMLSQKFNPNKQIRRITMDNEIIKRVESVELMSKTHDDKVAELQDNYNNLLEMHKALKEKNEQLQENRISKSEFVEFTNKMSTDFEKLADDIETAKNSIKQKGERICFSDFRSLISHKNPWLFDENGKRFTEVQQRGYNLFQMEVNYEAMNAGQELRNLRNLHDAVILVDAYNRFRDPNRYNIHNLGLFQQLIKETEKFDPDLSLAMAGGNTGYGAEWLPTEMSSEFNEYLRVEPTLAAKFPWWNMPAGATGYFPFQNGKAVVYKGGEATTNNPQEARKTDAATSRKQFTPDMFIGALVTSEELTEDAIVEMVTYIRKELATALLEGLEDALVNGDDSTTHFDNATVSTTVPDYSVQTCCKGIRKLGIDATGINIETVSGDTGVYAMTIPAMIDIKTNMGVAGLRSQECLWVTGVLGRGTINYALYTAGVNNFDTTQTIINGTVPTIDGAPVYISGMIREDLDSNGVYHGTNVGHTTISCVHTPSFRIATRRGVTLEYTKNILTQQQAFVATGRYDFGQVCSSNLTPVKSGINVQVA